MATDRLKIYNGALMICGERSLAALTDNNEPRRALDEVWNDGGVRYCLEQAQWKFAMCASKLSYDTGITPPFGYTRAFAKPADWVLTSAVCTDEYFNNPLTRYSDEVGFWFADLDEIYVKYVSDGASYGSNMAAWPASFTEYVKSYFASRIVLKVTADEKRRNTILAPKEGLLSRNLVLAKSRDAMTDPPKFPPTGSWVSARRGAGGGRYGDGGSSGNLIG